MSTTIGRFECESQPPLHYVNGFTLHGGNVDIDHAYAIYPLGVILIVTVKIGDAQRQLWRRVWAPRDTAVDAAEQLCYDSEEYLIDTLGCRPRGVEDTDLNDFVHHLDMRINNGFH